jgi:hypothetical protein
MTTVTMQKDIEEMKTRISHLEKVLIIGDGDRLPLAEIVRSLTKTVSDYIAQKDKEEQDKKNEWNRWKWLIIGIIVPAFLAFMGQAIIFYVRVLPIIENIK